MKTILIVDDNPAFTTLYRRILELDGGYVVFTENKAVLAVEYVRKCRPDLIMMDILMPDMLGSDVAAKLRDDPTLEHTKVIFVTSMLKESEVAKANESAGGHRIISKAISGKDLLLVIEHELGYLDSDSSAISHLVPVAIKHNISL